MYNKKLTENINIRLNAEDMTALKREADRLRVPVSTYCRIKLTENIIQL